MDSDITYSAISEMVNEIGTADAIYKPSEFWVDICAKNVKMLQSQGLENFKRTLAQNYFNWLIFSPLDPQFRCVLRYWPRHFSHYPFTNKVEPLQNILTTFSWQRALKLRWYHALAYKFFVSLLWEFMRVSDHTGMNHRLEEPSLGNPILIYRNGKRISQDLANSILEYNFILDNIADLVRRPRVAELGAGYGRLAYVFLSNGDTKYYVFDIPPSLYVSQWYLSNLFSDKRIFLFRHFTDFEEIEDELRESDIAFFSANQLAKFPNDFFDVFVTISTLAEMSLTQIENYLFLMNRCCSKYIYLKQWADWYNPADKTHVTREHYRFPAVWDVVTERQDPVMPLFFNKIWKKKNIS